MIDREMFSFWPGYQGLVKHGRWSFLGLALVFALLLDLFLLVNFYWTDMITPAQRNGLLAGLFAAWIVLFLAALFRGRLLESLRERDPDDQSIKKVIDLYLQGSWLETDSMIVSLLKENPRDVELLLLQATLYRHARRYHEAQAVLQRLDLLENSRRWFLEIEEEKDRIRQCLERLGDKPEDPEAPVVPSPPISSVLPEPV